MFLLFDLRSITVIQSSPTRTMLDEGHHQLATSFLQLLFGNVKPHSSLDTHQQHTN